MIVFLICVYQSNNILSPLANQNFSSLDLSQLLVLYHVENSLVGDRPTVLIFEVIQKVKCADLVSQTDSLPDGLLGLLDFRGHSF
jgi:hypothetical protein